MLLIYIRADSSRRGEDKVSVSPYPHPVLVCVPGSVSSGAVGTLIYTITPSLCQHCRHKETRKGKWKVKERELPVIDLLQLYESGGWWSGGVRKQREVREQY